MEKSPIDQLITFAKKKKTTEQEILKKLLKVIMKWKDKPEKLVKLFNSLLSVFDKKKISIKNLIKHGTESWPFTYFFHQIKFESPALVVYKYMNL